MVLLAASILLVSLSFLAYKYGTSIGSRPLKKPPDFQHGSGEQSPAPEGDDKTRPAVTLNLPEPPENDTDRETSRPAARMKNPFEDPEDQKKDERPLLTPTSNSTPSRKSAPSNALMPPPPSLPTKKSPSVPLKPSTIPSLHPPPSTASTLRAPPTKTPTPSSSLLAPSTSTLAPSARPSRKVQLEPGHSPLDWAHLTRNPPTATFLRGADVPPQLIRVPPSLLKYHNGRKDKETGKKKDAWGVWQGKVYNLTPYLKFHPGGEDQLMRGAGNTKAEALFNETHRWVSWESMMGECLVGILVSENEARREGEEEGGGMEGLD